MVGGVYEVVRLVGGLRRSHITTTTTSTTPRGTTTALATSSGDIIIFDYREGESTTRKIPWTSDDNHKPVALAFSPTAEWLLVASEDGTLFVIPLGGYLDPNVAPDHRFKTDDVLVLPPNGSRARPTALVWWQTLVGDTSLAIIGTELGELSFVEISTGKEVGGTYITVPVTELFICRDNSLDTVYLLITGTEERQWRLVLEQRSSQYLYPLEHLSPEWPDDDSSGSLRPLGSASVPPPRSRLQGLKQLSVEKLQLLKQRLAEAKQGRARRPLTENKGVDTCDIDEISAIPTAEAMTASTTSAGSDEVVCHISSRPERLSKFIHEVLATPQYAKERYLLAGHCKPNESLMVYSTDLEPTPLYVFKLPTNAGHIVLQDEIIFVSDASSKHKVTIVSTFFAASSKIDGQIDSRINPVVQEIELPEGEEIIALFPCPALHGLDLPSTPPPSGSSSTIDDDGLDGITNMELPSHTWPHGCLIVTKTSLYTCQTRASIETQFMDLVLCLGDTDGANRLGVIFYLDPKLFEIAADAKLRARQYASAITLYKHSRCPHVRCSIKFAAHGLLSEFLTYMGTLTSGTSTPDLGLEERRNLANMAVICHLYQLCHPILGMAKQPLKNLLVFLRDNQYYDEGLALILAAGSWRWETLQYLSSARGLHLEKIQVLLDPQPSPVLDLLSDDEEAESEGEDQTSNLNCPLSREQETGYLHCISDPEIGHYILTRPTLARAHMALVRSLLDSLDIPVLNRLAALYDPSRPSVRPFLQPTTAKWQGYPSLYPLSSIMNSSNSVPYGSDGKITLESFVEIFLAIVVKLNQKRGWNYSSTLLTSTIEAPKQIQQVSLEMVTRCPLACGYGHSAAIISGQVYTWGMPDYGVLGHGVRTTTCPKLLEGINLPHAMKKDVFASGTGLNSANNNPANFLSLFLNGKVGANLAPVTDGSEPRLVSVLANMRIFSVACGKNHMLALTDNGVYGWGSSKYGQVGTGSTGRFPHPMVISCLEGASITSVACGQFHSMAVSATGKLYTWGWGVHGQLGHGNVEDVLQPRAIMRLSKKQHITAVAGGYAHTVALAADGKVYAWGCGTYGQIGNGAIAKVSKPKMVPMSYPVTHIAAGYFHNLAVTKSHKVFVWGSNPACLRVQAQLQKRAKMMNETKKNADEEENKANAKEEEKCDDRENGEEEVKQDDEEKLQGVTEGNEIVDSESESQDPSCKVSSDYDEDVIMTLPEEQGDGSTQDKEFEISPEPSPKDKTPIMELGLDNASDENTDSDSNSTKDKSSNSCQENQDTQNNSYRNHDETVTLCRQPQPITVNTVPSCDPNDLGHLTPKEVEMPEGFGAVKAVACGNQHCVLLTTHGSLYTWGRNICGQLGTGNKREVLTPVRVLEEAHVTDIACGSDFTLAIDAQGRVWGFGSNYYSQLGKGGPEEDKGQAGRVFMLRTTKRVLKVPHSVHSNCEAPRLISGLPTCTSQPASFSPHYQAGCNGGMIDQPVNALHWLSGIQMGALEKLDPDDISNKFRTEAASIGMYGEKTLHTALQFLHSTYNTKNIITMLKEAEAHQALARVYALERQYSQAMHHQLQALFRGQEDKHSVYSETKENDPSDDKISIEKEVKSTTKDVDSTTENDVGGFAVTENGIVQEAVRIVDHFLHLQNEESQSGTQQVLHEGISQWLNHALPLSKLEELLLAHLPRTVYPLALLLFGDGTSKEDKDEKETAEGKEEDVLKVLSHLSTKFCLNLCSSVVHHLEAGGIGNEYVDALAKISGVSEGTTAESSVTSLEDTCNTPSFSTVLGSLAMDAPDKINLGPDHVAALKKEDKESKEDEQTKKVKHKEVPEEKGKSKTDCVLFTCGHHFTTKEFQDRVHLARLRCGHHLALLSYQKRLDDRIVNSCPGCNTSPHTIQHIMEDCIIHNHARKQHNIHSIKDLWENPVSAMAFLGETGLLGQTV
ncbi:RCC1 and BTB domain containing protein claret isoform X3 [Oratosquilla oratoria]|uniref:RCC1 and BTB domain containing protein claret isoform X3 n=1 Tax=Oratosquilla oratoria TaxID=337810 RepID=UPI003F761EA4